VDFEFERKWTEVVQEQSKHFGEPLSLDSMLFLIGLQELNKGYLKLTKDQKLEVMHVAVCRLLEPYGYYEFTGLDDDGWPHFQLKEKLPALDKKAQERLIKEAVIDYFSN
jgi:hypothetical protein